MSNSNFQTRLNDTLINFLNKENQILHYNRYSYALLFFEKYLIKNNLIDDALSQPNLQTLKDYNSSKERLQHFNKTYKDFLDELVFKSVYQSFEEFLFEILFVLYQLYPAFMSKDKENIEMNFQLFYQFENMDDARNHFIESKVKSIIQSNNIVLVIKKIESTFSIQFLLEKSTSDYLFVASRNRNILTHNGGKVNSIYLRELRGQNITSQFSINENIISKLEGLTTEILDNIPDLARKIYDTLISKEEHFEKYSASITK